MKIKCNVYIIFGILCRVLFAPQTAAHTIQTMDGAVLQACHIKVSQQLILFSVLINYFIISATTILVVGVYDNVLQTFFFLMIYLECVSMSKREVVSNLVQILLYIPNTAIPLWFNLLLSAKSIKDFNIFSSVELNWN